MARHSGGNILITSNYMRKFLRFVPMRHMQAFVTSTYYAILPQVAEEPLFINGVPIFITFQYVFGK